jgi:Fe-S cluster biogenesis protein NfuA
MRTSAEPQLNATSGDIELENLQTDKEGHIYAKIVGPIEGCEVQS